MSGFVYGNHHVQPAVGPVQLPPVDNNGNLQPGVYRYAFTYFTNYGESMASPITTCVNSNNSIWLELNTAPHVVALGIYRGEGANPLFFIEKIRTTRFRDSGSVATAIPLPIESFGDTIGEERGYIVKTKPVCNSIAHIIASVTPPTQPNDPAQIHSEFNFVSGVGYVRLPPVNFELKGMIVLVKTESNITIVPSNPATLIDGNSTLALQSGNTVKLLNDTDWIVLNTSGGGSVDSIDATSVGFTGSTIGDINVGGTLNVANGGTGISSAAAGSIILGNGTSQFIAQSTVSGRVLGAGGWTTLTQANGTFTASDPSAPTQLATFNTVLTRAPLVFDSSPTVKYPVNLTKGVWYGVGTFNANSGAQSVGLGTVTSSGARAIAIAGSTTASGADSVAIGRSSTASGTGTVILGASMNAGGGNNVVGIGNANNVSGGIGSVAIGTSNTATGTGCVALGRACSATGTYAVATGRSSAGTRGFSFGTTGGGQAFAFLTAYPGTRGFAMGVSVSNPQFTGTDGIILNGGEANAGTAGIAMGDRTNWPQNGGTGAAHSISLLYNSLSYGVNSQAWGQLTRATGARSLCWGASSGVYGNDCLAYGVVSSIGGTRNIVLGVELFTSGTDNIVIGRTSGSSSNGGERNITFGYDAMRSTTRCRDCITAGYQTLRTAVSAQRNICFGIQAGLRIGQVAVSGSTLRQDNNTLTYTGSGLFLPEMVGGIALWPSGAFAYLTAYVSAFSFTATPTQTIANSTGTVVCYGTQYSVGTISASGTTVTGVGTTFTREMVGGRIVFGVATKFSLLVVSYVSPTVLTISASATVASTTFTLYYADASGNIIFGPNPTSIHDGPGNIIMNAGNGTVNRIARNTIALGNFTNPNLSVQNSIALKVPPIADDGFYSIHRADIGNAAQFNGNELVELVSSRRYKENIKTLEEAPINIFRPVRYNTSDNTNQIGLIAEEVAGTYPEVVNMVGDQISGIDYGRIVAILLADRKHIIQRIEQLENRLRV